MTNEIERRLNRRQELFCQAFAAGGNAAAAAREAGYSVKAADRIGERLLRNVEIAARIKALSEENDAKLIATSRERQQLWTAIMRDTRLEPKDRLKASELLGKAQGDFLERVALSGPNGTSPLVPPVLQINFVAAVDGRPVIEAAP
jgi:phage terminase small subunit